VREDDRDADCDPYPPYPPHLPYPPYLPSHGCAIDQIPRPCVAA
jgi:hypothetical protein